MLAYIFERRQDRSHGWRCQRAAYLKEEIISTRRTIIPAGLESVYEHWHYAPAVISNGTVYCSGIIGTASDSREQSHTGAESFGGARSTLRHANAPLSALRALENPEAQFATAFEILKAILDDAGVGLRDIIELVTYHVDIRQHMEVFMKVRDRYIVEPYPAWTCIGVSELIVPGGLVELRATAALPA